MEMHYAIVQTEAAAPSADQLKRAFKSFPRMTEADAVKLAKDAFGILMRNLSLADATGLQRALLAEGVPTEVVEAGQLPSLPEAKLVKRVELQSEALLIYDPLGRTVMVDWRQVALISAGACRHFSLSQTRTQDLVQGYNPIRGFHAKVEPDVRHRVEDDTQLVLDIFLAKAVMRFQIEASTFHFKYTFDRPELSRSGKFALLVQRLIQHAPQAWVNRGAHEMCENSPNPVAYASKTALWEESVWLLWQQSRQSSGGVDRGMGVIEKV